MTSTEVAFKADLDRPLSGVEQRRIFDLLREDKRRKCEALKLYDPLPTQEALHRSVARIKLAIGGNRAGKTVSCAVEFARAMCGADPYEKYPKTDGKAYVVGKSLKHIGDTIYPMLFRAGAFRMIRDEETGYWRTYKPWVAEDRARKEYARPAPPLIPPRMIKGKVAWHSKAKREPSRVDLVNGWEINFFSAEGRLPRGAQIDVGYLDEECPNSPDGEWVPELLARLMDRSGKLLWSATPHAGFDQLYDLFLKAEEQEQKFKLDPVTNPRPEIANFQFDLADNQYISAADKVWFLSNLTAEEARIRGTGEFTVSSMRVYPEFNPSVHGWPMASNKPPDRWTNYAYIDPGFTVCAVLFVSCPPLDECPGEQPLAIAYDELYLPQCNAPLFGARMKEKCENLAFEAFYIDVHGAPREAGSGQSIREQYAQALKKNGVMSRATGHDFYPAGDDRRAGVMAVHTMLVVRKDGGSHFRVAVEPGDKSSCKLPNLLFNMRRYRKKKIRGVITDDTEDRGDTHLCQCMRYMALSEPEWVEAKVKQMTPMDWAYEQVVFKSRQRQAEGAYFFFGPGE